MFTLAEEVFLLSLLEKKDSIRMPSSLSLPFSLAGAILIDLVISGYAQHEVGRISLKIDPEQITDEQMKLAAEKLRHPEKLKKMGYWVYLLGTKGKRLMRGIVQSLVEKEILVEEGQVYRWASSQQESETTAPKQSKYHLKRDIRDAVFCQGIIPDRNLAVIDLMDSSDLMDHLFTKDEMIAVRKKIKSSKQDESLSSSFIDLLKQMDEAIDYAVASAIMK